MPDPIMPTAPVAEEGSTTTPEPVQADPTPAEQPVSRQEQIAQWLKGPKGAVAPKTPEEEPAKPAASPEPEVPKDLSQSDDAEQPALPAGDLGKAVRRIRLLKEERKELKSGLASAEDRIRALEAETEKLRTKTQPAPAVSFDDVEDTETLAKEASTSQAVYAWADARLDRVVTQEDAEEVGLEMEAQGFERPEDGWTVKAVRDPLLKLKTTGSSKWKAAQARVEWLKTEEASLNQIAQLLPELGEEKSDLSDRVNQVVQARPWLKRLPDWPTLAAVAALGLQELDRRQKPRAVPQAAPVAVPVAPRVPGAPARATPAPADKLEQLRKRANRPGATREDRIALIKETLLRSREIGR